MLCGIRYDRAHDDRMVRALVSSLWITMTHQNFINAIAVLVVGGWLPFQIANAAEPDAASAATATPAAAAAATAPAADAVAPAPVATAPKAENATAQTTPNPDDEIICKKIDVFGSRVRKAKMCRTRKEWQLESQAAKDYSKGVDKGTSMQPGGQALPTGG